MANEQLANSFSRVLAGREQVDYSKKEYAQSNVAVIRKPWEWQKKVYQNLELHLDAAIDKVDSLAKDVELQRMEKKWDELHEQTHQEGKETVTATGGRISIGESNMRMVLRRLRHIWKKVIEI